MGNRDNYSIEAPDHVECRAIRAGAREALPTSTNRLVPLVHPIQYFAGDGTGVEGLPFPSGSASLL